jgi:hypothetical protein
MAHTFSFYTTAVALADTFALCPCSCWPRNGCTIPLQLPAWHRRRVSQPTAAGTCCCLAVAFGWRTTTTTEVLARTGRCSNSAAAVARRGAERLVPAKCAPVDGWPDSKSCTPQWWRCTLQTPRNGQGVVHCYTKHECHEVVSEPYKLCQVPTANAVPNSSVLQAHNRHHSTLRMHSTLHRHSTALPHLRCPRRGCSHMHSTGSKHNGRGASCC